MNPPKHAGGAADLPIEQLMQIQALKALLSKHGHSFSLVPIQSAAFHFHTCGHRALF